jgi:hypothetical protein
MADMIVPERVGGGPRPERCETCRFWEDAGDDEGLCRRRAPLPYSTRDDEHVAERTAWWPFTHPHDWCGEWGPEPVSQVGG